MARITDYMRLPLIWIIRTYQYILSPLLGPRCRFYPTCSEYTVIAVQRFGVVQGGYLGVRRLLKCHPWHSGGVDFVPDQALSETEKNCRH